MHTVYGRIKGCLPGWLDIFLAEYMDIFLLTKL